jgi:hypothetical protein
MLQSDEKRPGVLSVKKFHPAYQTAIHTEYQVPSVA